MIEGILNLITSSLPSAGLPGLMIIMLLSPCNDPLIIPVWSHVNNVLTISKQNTLLSTIISPAGKNPATFRI